MKVADVAAAGGYTMDASFDVDPSLGSSSGAVIDYANTDQLRMTGGNLRFVQYGELLNYAINSPTITANTWYHATAVFDCRGFSPVPDPDYAGYNKIQGMMHLYLNGAEVVLGSPRSSPERPSTTTRRIPPARLIPRSARVLTVGMTSRG